VEALKALDNKTKIKTFPLEKLRTQLNDQILNGEYETPLGKIAFDPDGEVKQGEFYVAQIKMEADGKTGKFTFVK
jgi:branched-chain amino acid transport system substrate-binding protein